MWNLPERLGLLKKIGNLQNMPSQCQLSSQLEPHMRPQKATKTPQWDPLTSPAPSQQKSSYGCVHYIQWQSVTQLFAIVPQSYQIYDPNMSWDQPPGRRHGTWGVRLRKKWGHHGDFERWPNLRLTTCLLGAHCASAGASCGYSFSLT